MLLRYGQWLENFAYHIEPGIFTFAAGVVLSLIVVLATVGTSPSEPHQLTRHRTER